MALLSSDLFVLMRFRWQLFGTLTFKEEWKVGRIGRSTYQAMVRWHSRQFGIYYPSVLWALRTEVGEVGERGHNHFLLAGIPPELVTVATCFALMGYWEKRMGMGYARIHLYDPTLHGLDYVTKCLGYQEGALGLTPGAFRYEVGKFAHASEVNYSDSVWDVKRHTRTVLWAA